MSAPFPMASAPRDGSFITLHRSDGTTHAARWAKMPGTLFRDPDAFHWLTETGKFAEVTFAVAIGWSPRT